jgi:DMSO/TMAO reductase YedYZ molybdopterin-dependent catalytic subunit
MKRKDVRPPKFADQFFKIDFESEPLPVLSLYPFPESLMLESVRISVAGLDLVSRSVSWQELAGISPVRSKQPMICQIFNWSEEVEWEGIRLVDVLDQLSLETGRDGYYAVYSRDGHYFETLSRDEARDPRVLLAYGLNGGPLPLEHGGPLRLVVPFLQGYKSVKWVKAIRAVNADPMGIKRLRGQSRKARLSDEWRNRHAIHPPEGKTGDPDD